MRVIEVIIDVSNPDCAQERMPYVDIFVGIQVVRCTDGDFRMVGVGFPHLTIVQVGSPTQGREFQLDHWPEWQWQIKHS